MGMIKGLKFVRLLSLTFVILLAVSLFVLWLLIYRTGSQAKYKVQLEQNQKPASYLTPDQLKSEFSKYLALLEKQNPRDALENLRGEIKINDALSRDCHELAHELGHAAIEKYKTFGSAIQYQDDVCGSGYMHGVLESYFEENKADILNVIENTCKNYTKQNYAAWECYHGIGHGIMFSNNNNLPQSINLCKSLTDNFANSACTNGVFMQNFTTDAQIHPSIFLSKSNFFYPCANQSFRDMSYCYGYAPSYFLHLHSDNYKEALNWCNEAPYFFINTCKSGVGSEAIKQNINNPKMVESICSAEQNSGRNACIEGMVNLYILHYGSLNPAKDLCKKMASENASVCLDEIRLSKTLF